MPTFECVTECYHNNQRWFPGDGKTLTADKAPKHFKEVKDDTKASRRTVIKTALLALDANNDELWNKDGKPAVRAVEDKVGFDTNREEIEDALPGFLRDVKAFKDAKPDFLG